MPIRFVDSSTDFFGGVPLLDTSDSKDDFLCIEVVEISCSFKSETYAGAGDDDSPV